MRASRQLRREAQKAGVSALDAQLLGLIFKQPGIGGGELADLEQMSRAFHVGPSQAPRGAGWIARDPARQDDRRRGGLRVTDTGTLA